MSEPVQIELGCPSRKWIRISKGKGGLVENIYLDKTQAEQLLVLLPRYIARMLAVIDPAPNAKPTQVES